MKNDVIDKNFLAQNEVSHNTKWYSPLEEPFSLYGLLPKEGMLSQRLPAEVAEKTSDGVVALHCHAAGGRVRFSTNSSKIAIRVIYGNGDFASKCSPATFTYGFDLYRHEGETEIFLTGYRMDPDFDFQTLELEKPTRNEGKMTAYTLNFPCYSEVKELFIGLDATSQVEAGVPYCNEKPVVFYGSSITQGAAACRPGNTYQAMISQKYNIAYTNLGFSGNALGETVMAEYIAGLSMSAFVLDYDHNAPNAEHLEKTHEPFYRIVREKNPTIPIIMVSKPDFFSLPKACAERRDIIRRNYERAKAAGDQNVYFIDGETLFAGDYKHSCTVDGVHPNDLGFYRMAEKIGPVLASALGLSES